MKLFGQIIGTVVEVVKLPVDLAKDVVCAGGDVSEGEDIGHRTKDRLDAIKDAARED